MDTLATVIMYAGCALGGLAIVVGFIQMLFAGVWNGLKTMGNGAVIVVCAVIVSVLIAPVEPEPVDMSPLTYDELQYVERFERASARFLRAAEKLERLVESTAGMVTDEEAARADPINGDFYEARDMVQWAPTERFSFTHSAFGEACWHYEEAAQWYTWERDVEEARRKIAEGRKAWRECLREWPEVLSAGPSPPAT